MLQIPRSLIDAMVDHATASHPIEACGVISGSWATGIPTRHIPLVNAAQSTEFYEVGSAELLQLYRNLDDAQEVPVIIYHSHTSTPAVPSATDIALASEPDAHYVLISTRDWVVPGDPIEVRSFRIVDGQVSEEPLEVRPDQGR